MNIKKYISGRAAISCQEKSSSKNGDSFVNITRFKAYLLTMVESHITLSPFSFFLVLSVTQQ
jgi:hypothetical protein